MQSRRGGFTIVELVIVVAIIVILLAFLIPGLASSRKAAHESNAIAGLRTLYLSQVQYRTRFGRIADPLSDLQNAGYTDDFTIVGDHLEKTGYQFRITTVANRTIMWARPIDIGNTGDRFFAISPSGVIHWAERRVPEEDDPVVDTRALAAR